MSAAEYGIYRQNGIVVWLCTDHLHMRRNLHDCDELFPDDDDKVHRRSSRLPPVECYDCEDEEGSAEDRALADGRTWPGRTCTSACGYCGGCT